MLISFVFFDWVNNTFHAALLLIDQVIYWLASQCYQLFIKLASTKLFEESFFANFANRIYTILGVFMLFYLAYALLTAVIDPEKLTGKDKGAPKIAMNLVISLVLLGFLPSIFSYAYRIQNLVLSRNVIGSMILGTGMVDVDSSNQAMLGYGDVLSFSVLNTFLNPENENFQIANNYSWFNFKEDVLTKSDYSAMPSMSKAVSTGAGKITESGSLGQTIVISYMPFISAAAGIFLVYIMISFTLDLGVRVAKFAFYQLLAPIPIIMRIIPGKKGVFDKWLKQTLSVYFEVFVRVGIMYISVFFINEISTSGTVLDQFFGPNTGVQGKLAFAIVIMGVLAFAKEMPKKLSDILGIDTGGLKLGIKDKLKAGGFFGATAAAGAAITSGFNPFAISRAWKAGNKDGTLTSIGQEAALRRKVLDESKKGSTWIGRRGEDVRKYLGFNARVDDMNRKIENMDYRTQSGQKYSHSERIYDANGNEIGRKDIKQITQEYIDRRKQQLLTMHTEIDETIRIRKVSIDQNNNAVNAFKAIEEEAYKKIELQTNHDVDRSITGQYGNFTGNYRELEAFVKQLEENMVPDINSFGGNQAAYEAALKDHTEKINEYKKELSNARIKMKEEYISKAMSGAVNNAVINSKVESIQADLDAGDLSTTTITSGSAVTNFASLKTVKDELDKANSQLNADNYSAEIKKRSSLGELKELERAEAIHKEQQETIKQKHSYHAAQADKNSRNAGGK